MTIDYVYQPLDLHQEHWPLVTEYTPLELHDDDLSISCLLSDISNGTNTDSTICDEQAAL